MALITIPQLERAAVRRQRVEKSIRRVVARARLLKEAGAPLTQNYDVFLSHRFLDADHVLVVKELIGGLGYTVYVDWIHDKNLPRDTVTAETARRVRTRITYSRSLLVVVTEGMPSSKWIPWELGYADGLRKRVGIVPVLNADIKQNTYAGQEYLGLYPYIDITINDAGRHALWVNQASSNLHSLGAPPGKTYVPFGKWLRKD